MKKLRNWKKGREKKKAKNNTLSQVVQSPQKKTLHSI